MKLKIGSVILIKEKIAIVLKKIKKNIYLIKYMKDCLNNEDFMYEEINVKINDYKNLYLLNNQKKLNQFIHKYNSNQKEIKLIEETIISKLMSNKSTKYHLSVDKVLKYTKELLIKKYPDKNPEEFHLNKYNLMYLINKYKIKYFISQDDKIILNVRNMEGITTSNNYKISFNTFNYTEIEKYKELPKYNEDLFNYLTNEKATIRTIINHPFEKFILQKEFILKTIKEIEETKKNKIKIFLFKYYLPHRVINNHFLNINSNPIGSIEGKINIENHNNHSFAEVNRTPLSKKYFYKDNELPILNNIFKNNEFKIYKKELFNYLNKLEHYHVF